MLRSSATHFYQADGLGSVTSLSDSTSSLASTYTYDSFGNLASSTGNVTNPFRYTAREWDADASLYYYRARFYDPSVGRFLSEDPMQFLEGVNFFPYALNRPVDFTDPYGLQIRRDLKEFYDQWKRENPPPPTSQRHPKKLGIGGKVINNSQCCVLVSTSEGVSSGQQQFYLAPGEQFGGFWEDVDAIYFPNGTVLKITNITEVVITQCFPEKADPLFVPAPYQGRLLKLIRDYFPRRWSPELLQDMEAARTKFGRPIRPPVTCPKDKCP